MIYLNIKTIWNEEIGIHEKFIQEALKKKEDITFRGKIGEMTIANKDIEKSIVRYSQPFKDKFSNGYYNLLYFKWKPKDDDQIAKEEFLTYFC